MKTWMTQGHGPAETLKRVELPEPVPGPGEVRVHVMAAGLTALDGQVRQGKWHDAFSPRFPWVPGCEFSGVVDRVGPGVAGWSAGDEVWALVDPARGGSLAERVIVRQEELAFKPKRLSHVHAATMPLALLVSWQALVERADLQAGQKVLIHAAAGGVGSIAVQLVEHLGAYASGTCSARNLYYLLDLGVVRSIDTYMTRFEHVVTDRHVVLDAVGGSVTARSIAATRKGGTVVSIAGPPDAATLAERGAGVFATMSARTVHLRHNMAAAMRGVRWGTLLARPDGALLQRLTEVVESGAIAPQVLHIYPFEEAALGAHQVDGRATRGKRVVAVDPVAAVGQSASENVLNDSRNLFSNAAKRSKGPAASSTTTESPETNRVSESTQSSEP